MQIIEEILHFWFGDLKSDSQIHPEKREMWFEKNEEIDATIRERFEATLIATAQGNTQHWETTPRGMLALIILLDQFSRNLYRESPQAFAQDAQVLALALKSIQNGMDSSLRPIERIFLYMPLMHSEQLEHQKQCISLFEKLCKDAPEPIQPIAQSSLQFAHRHCEIIEQFGRFPHRNEVLKRASTEEEKAFLLQPNSRF